MRETKEKEREVSKHVTGNVKKNHVLSLPCPVAFPPRLYKSVPKHDNVGNGWGKKYVVWARGQGV
jgi:hypothetical protein